MKSQGKIRVQKNKKGSEKPQEERGCFLTQNLRRVHPICCRSGGASARIHSFPLSSRNQRPHACIYIDMCVCVYHPTLSTQIPRGNRDRSPPDCKLFVDQTCRSFSNVLRLPSKYTGNRWWCENSSNGWETKKIWGGRTKKETRGQLYKRDDDEKKRTPNCWLRLPPAMGHKERNTRLVIQAR